MVVSHKDWELRNSQIGFAGIAILDRHLDRQRFIVKNLQTKIIEYFHVTIFAHGSAKKPDEKKVTRTSKL